MTHTTLPHWDMTVVYPGLDSPEFEQGFRAAIGSIDDLTALFDSHGIALRDAAALDETTVAQLQEGMQAGRFTARRLVELYTARIEQIDRPFELYCRPKTKFVAGFIGRTNFMEGRQRGDEVDFGGFSVPSRALGGNGRLAERVQVSVRPQSIHLHRSAPPP